MSFDVVIVGGGPAGLAAALNLGRARKRVLLCDAGVPRNATAERVHGFVTRDGMPPADFRRVGREQLGAYPGVEVRDVRVEVIRPERGAFMVELATEVVETRRVLLCTGMIDDLPDIPGLHALWGRSVFQCPYCHAWEVQDHAFGFLAPSAEMLEFALLLRGWTSDVIVLTDGRFAVPPEMEPRLTAAGVRIDTRRITRLSVRDGHLEGVELADGGALRLDVLFARPPQRQVAVVHALGLELDAAGYVRVDDQRQTSIPGIYAAGDLVTPVQSASLAAASGAQAATTLNRDLTAALATSGALA